MGKNRVLRGKGEGEEGGGGKSLLRRDVTRRKPSLDLVVVCFFVLE